MHRIGSYHRLIALLIFIPALAVRLVGITEQELQIDERHWVSRSAEVLKRAHSDPRHITTHLGHPGVPAALVMALGQAVAEKINERRGVKEGQPGFIYRIDASRVAIALFSSLLILIVFFGAFPFIGFWGSFLSTALVAFDPYLFGLSRIAHIDSTLTVFVALTVFIYAYSLQVKSVLLRLLAGACWGFAVSVKPTAAVIVVALILYRIISSILSLKRPEDDKFPLFSWADLGAVLTGHAVFAAIYTRLWDHWSDYRVRLQIRIRLAKYLFQTGRFFQLHSYYFIGLIVGLLVVAVITWNYFRRKKSGICYHTSLLMLYSIILLSVLTAFPAVFENFARFWKWVATLSGEGHDSFGKIIPTVKYGYAGLFVTRLPVYVLLSFIAGVMLAVFKMLKRGDSWAEKFILLLTVIIICWAGILSVSSKQTWRYLAPVIPFIYVCAGYFIARIAARLADLNLKKKMRVCLQRGIMGGLVLSQCVGLYDWRPHYMLYRNSLAGSLAALIKNNLIRDVVGEKQVIGFIVNTAKNNPVSYVSVVGDAGAMSYTLRRFYPDFKDKIKFGYFRYIVADYLIVPTTQVKVLGLGELKDRIEPKPAYTYSFRGAEFMHVYRVLSPDYSKPEVIKIDDGFRHIGAIRYDKRLKTKVVGPLKTSQPGYLFFYPAIHIGPGKFTVRVPVLLDENKAPRKAAEVLQLELGSYCIRTVKTSELSTEKIVPVSLKCSFNSETHAVPRVYWKGKYQVLVGDISIRRVRGANQ